MKDKKLWIDCCAGSELKDTQGETLSIEGADISELQAGRGRWNDDHGKGNFNHLGMITEAKKIFKAEDCENERHKYYWDKIKASFIYTKGYLHNNEDHPNARATAAILRNIHREDCPLKLKASVEGGVMARGITDPTRLAQTKIHSVALTFTPANTATLVEPLNLDKSANNWSADQQLIKSVMHLAETNIPSFRHIERHASANTIIENINKIKELAKSVGLDIQVSSSTPEAILKQTATNKIEQNIKKINELVKSVDPKTSLNAKIAPTDKPLKTFDDHAIAAHKDPKHLDNVVKQLKITNPELSEQHVDQIINKIKTHMKIIKSKKYLQIKDSLIKSITAGFGGAGAPMDLTGGGVLQSESVESKKKSKKKSQLNKSYFDAETSVIHNKPGMQYITCDNCGKENVYMKYQVKCRNCHRNFNFDKLKDLI
jgi:hypothetical protein